MIKQQNLIITKYWFEACNSEWLYMGCCQWRMWCHSDNINSISYGSPLVR